MDERSFSLPGYAPSNPLVPTEFLPKTLNIDCENDKYTEINSRKQQSGFFIWVL